MRMGACEMSVKENIVCAVDSVNETVSVLVSRMGESKKCLSLVREDVLRVSEVDECVKKCLFSFVYSHGKN